MHRLRRIVRHQHLGYKVAVSAGELSRQDRGLALIDISRNHLPSSFPTDRNGWTSNDMHKLEGLVRSDESNIVPRRCRFIM